MADDSPWVVLLVTCDELEADMVKDVLEAGGIEAVIRSSKVSPYPVNIGRMGEVKVLVKEQDLREAEEILQEAREAGPGDLSD